MVTPELDEQRMKAGADYLAALRHLGLQPDALFWAFDQRTGQFVLMLATELFDFKGPLAVSEVLFKAFNAAATPQEIDPFIVRLHSPDHTLIRSFDGWKAATHIEQANGRPLPGRVNVEAVTIDEMMFRKEWVYRYKLPERPQKSVDLSRRWRRFTSNVDKVAA